MIRNLPIAAELLDFVAAGEPEPVMVWTDEGGRRVQSNRQETDEATGDPLFNIFAMTAAGGRPEIVPIRVPAKVQPVLSMFAPLAFDSLEVRVAVDRGGKLAGYWSARGVREVGPARKNGHQGGEHKPEGQPA